ncbi:hypothetical protein HYU10_05350 [Candidatus Woesearchaeota archaeon]|nr:hypothetical protein [Candidatus Woesearchaeota archaeon]
MSIEAKIVRKTRNGDWVARTDAGLEVLLPSSDERISFDTPVSLQGTRKGEHISFPDGGYTVGKAPREFLYRGLISSAFSHFGHDYRDDHWEATIALPGVTHLRKSSGPRDVDVGTMVDIYSVRKMGMRHRWIDEWSVSSVQYPEHPLTPEQEDLARRISSEFFNGPNQDMKAKAGTVALITGVGMVILSDGGYFGPPLEGLRIKYIRQLWNGEKEQEQFPVGTRVIYGPHYADGRYKKLIAKKIG